MSSAAGGGTRVLVTAAARGVFGWAEEGLRYGEKRYRVGGERSRTGDGLGRANGGVGGCERATTFVPAHAHAVGVDCRYE